MKSYQKLYAAIALAVAFTVTVFYAGGRILTFLKYQNPVNADSEHSQTTYWTCPMHLQIQRSGPGECPICHMALVSVHRHESEIQSSTSLPEPISESVNATNQTLIYHATGVRTVRVIPARGELIIPRSALVDTGKRKIVFVMVDRDRFVPRDVLIGYESGETLSLLQGLSEGETIVASGTFLIDSESRISNYSGGNP